MAADILTTLATWSTTEGSNLPIGSTAISTNLDDNLRMIQSVVRYTMASDTIASATTTDLGTKESQYLTVSGTTTITGLGTISAGITKYVTFSGALILTHNATSLILPGAANITTAAGDTGRFLSLGSGNWKCLNFTLASGRAVVSSPQMSDGTVSLPGMPFVSDLDSGIYRIGANNWALAANGAKVLEIATTGASVTGALTNTTSVGLGPSSTAIVVSAAGAVTVAPTSGQSTTFTAPSGNFIVNGTATTGGSVSLTAGAGQAVTIAGSVNTGASNAGAVNISGGTTATGAGGPIVITPGYSTTNQVGNDLSFVLPGTTTASNALFTSSAAFYKIVGQSKHIHVINASNTPTITSGGGTSPTIAGSDNAFRIVVGTGGSASTVTVTFNTAWANAPMAVANHQGALLPLRCVTTTTTCVIDAASAFTASGSIDVICIGRE